MFWVSLFDLNYFECKTIKIKNFLFSYIKFLLKNKVQKIVVKYRIGVFTKKKQKNRMIETKW